MAPSPTEEDLVDLSSNTALITGSSGGIGEEFAVQLFGGNGYMAEYQVEQLARDAKVLQIYAGTDEIQISQIARSLLGEAGPA